MCLGLCLIAVTVPCLYGNLRVGVVPALLYFNKNYQEKKGLLWVLFNSAQQLKISGFCYLGEWMFWYESWGKLYSLFCDLNVTKNNTFVIDLLNFSYSVTSSNFIVFSVFMLVHSFTIIAHVPENCIQSIFREITENNKQLGAGGRERETNKQTRTTTKKKTHKKHPKKNPPLCTG